MSSSPSAAHQSAPQEQTLFGHPVGLYTLFFAEMWERFSYYGMRALLFFYMTKGFLEFSDGSANTVYGSYTALVYMTPFFGGMLADRVLGQRRAVVLGGLLMAAGHLLLTHQETWAFYLALGLIITGNGFFKPNISTMVGSLYRAGHPRRDGGYTIFYIGVNLGAAFAPLLCGYIAETYGYHFGFGLATIGMLTGVAIFTAPILLTQSMIGIGAVAGACALIYFRPDGFWSVLFNFVVAGALLASGTIAVLALARGGLPKNIGQPADPAWLSQPGILGLSKPNSVYLCALIAVPILALFVSGFSGFTAEGSQFTIIPQSFIERFYASPSKLVRGLGTVVEEISKPAGLILMVCGIGAIVYLFAQARRLAKVPRERMYVAFALTFSSILFWAFFEQAGSSINNFTDRNVDRVGMARTIGASELGTTIRLQPTQEQFGYHNGSVLFTLTQLTELREAQSEPNFEIDWVLAPDNLGMRVATRSAEMPASIFQSVNAIFILIFGLIFTALWGYLAARKWEPGAPLKFALGLLQLGLGFGALWYGAQHADSRGMVALIWLILGYLLHTTGELCVSPVGLSMVSRLTPRQLVSTMMGAWFLATAFSQYLGGIISQFTNITLDEGGGIPAPKDTVQVYGNVYGTGALAVIIGAALLLLCVPLLNRWMHRELPE